MSYIKPIPLRTKGYETDENRRIYVMLQKFIPFITKTYQDWDKRPNCGYVFTGCHWYGADQNGAAALLSFMARFGQVDPSVVGMDSDEMREMSIRILRYACFTHDTGPADCVRVNGKNLQQANTKWGGNHTTFGKRRGQYFQSSQVGSGLVLFGLASWFLWEYLDEETRQMCYDVIVNYAERFAEMEPRDGTYYNTQSEENGWTADGIAVAAILFAADPRAKAWRDGAIRWMLDGASLPMDMFCTNIPSNGENVRGYMDHITYHPDFTTENHGKVHPDYMAAFLMQRTCILLYTLLGEKPIYPGLTHNWQNIYNQTFKLWSTPEGYAVPVQSQDWWYFRTFLSGNAATRLLFNDKEAAFLEISSLSTLEKAQKCHQRGTFISDEPEKCIISKDYQDLTDMEPSYGNELMKTFLLHYCLGEGVVPVDSDTFEKSIDAVREYPNGGLIVSRKPDYFTAFSFRNSCLAVVMPRDKTWTITTPPASTFGECVFTEPAENQGLANEENIRYMNEPRIFPHHEYYGASGVLDRGCSRANQEVAFISLEDGCSVYFEHFRANMNLSVEQFRSGLVGVRNDYYQTMEEWAPGERKLYINDAKPLVMRGYIGEQDEQFDFQGVKYAAIDDKMAYLIDGSQGVRYVGHHFYPKWKGIEDYLILNNHDAFTMKAGEKLPRFTMVFLPGRDIGKAKEAYDGFHTSLKGNCDAVILGERLIYASRLTEQGAVMASFRMERKQIPLFEGVCEWDGEMYTWTSNLLAREAGYRKQISAVSSNRPFRIVVLPDGEIVSVCH